MTGKAMIVGMAFAVIVGIGSLAEAQGPVGAITAIEGVADVTRGADGAVFLKENDAVSLNDRIRTKNYSKLEITFLDKSVVKLAPNTCLTVDTYTVDDKNKREFAELNLTRGKVEAVVAKTSRPESFVIRTPNATGKVKGSDIFMSYEAGKTGALVKEGLMSLASQGLPEKQVNVAKGDTTLVSFNKEPAATRSYLDAELVKYLKDVEPVFTKKKLFFEKTAAMTAAITTVSGEVRLYKKGAKDWRQAKMNELFTEGDKIQTGENGMAEIRLSNGNLIYLLANTELIAVKLDYNAKTGDYENDFESGMGRIKAVVEKIGTNSRFKIKTPTAECGVRGTIQYLTIQPGSTQAFYEGGSGYMTSTITNQTQDIGAGQNASSDGAGNLSVPVYTSIDQGLSLDQSFSGQGVAGGYSSPDNTPDAGMTLGGTTGQEFASGTDPLETPFTDTSLDAPTFAQTAGQTSAASAYSTTLNQLGTSTAGFTGATANITINNNQTWSATVNGTISTFVSSYPTGWTLAINDGTTTNQISLNGTPDLQAGVDTTWSASVNANASTVNGKTLSGSVTNGIFTGADSTFKGTITGTWQ
ncbi:MAG: FecR family protein [Candidatus Omnitrophica bacterium]|nr:FecR family protein [Candidatus Omnitrophota bacterium]